MSSRNTIRIRILGIIAALAFMSAAGPQALAQEQGVGRGLGGVQFMLVFPRGDFQKNVDDLAFGISGEIGYAIPSTPLAVGLQGGFATYGSDTYSVPFSETVGVVYVDVTSSNDMGLGHLFVRLQPDRGSFRPYIDGLLGISFFETSSSVKNQATGEEVASSTNESDVAFSYGARGGIAYRVYTSTANEGGRPLEVYIDLGARYIYGGEATYYKSDAFYKDGNSVKLDPSKRSTSKTDLMTVQLGAMLRF